MRRILNDTAVDIKNEKRYTLRSKVVSMAKPGRKRGTAGATATIPVRAFSPGLLLVNEQARADRIQQIRRLRRGGLSRAAIGRLMGVSRQRMARIFKRWNIP